MWDAETVNFLIGGGAGAAIGAAADTYAVHKMSKSQEEFHLPTVEAAIEADQAEANDEDQKRSRLAFLKGLGGKTVRLALPVVVGVSVGMLADVFTPQHLPNNQAKIELVVDDSGAVESVLPQVQEIVSQFDTTNNQTIVGNVGSPVQMKANTFTSWSNSGAGSPAGAAPLSEQVSLAFNQLVQSDSQTEPTKSALVIVTNGNSIGNLAQIENQAAKENVVVDPINVERKGTSPGLVKGLENLAGDTDGKFYDVNASNLSHVAKSVRANIVPNQLPAPDQDQVPLLIGSFALMFAGKVMYSNRRKYLTAKDYKGE
jgi:hypothetical protein